ncbi:MAG: hypothetical protein AAB434_10255 [Planctomycetota bacterium]
MLGLRCVSLVLLLVSAAWADEARRIQWKPRTGDRYDFSMTSAVDTEDTTQGREKEAELRAEVSAELRITEVDDDGDAKAVLRFRRIRASLDAGEREAKVDLDEKELSGSTVKVELGRMGGLSVDASDLDGVARGVELAVHFAGLFFQLPEDPIKEDQEWELDKGSISLRVRVRDIRSEGKDEIAFLDGTAKGKQERGGARAEAHGKVALEFNVTQGYLRLLDEDYSTKLSSSKGKVSVAMTRRVLVTKSRER